MPMAAVVKLPPLFNVSSMKLLIVNQCVSNSPSKIRGGRGALTPQEKVL